MIKKPMDVLTRFPVRKSQKQKRLFRDEIQSYVSTFGYESKVEKGSLGSRNLIIGNPDKAKFLITAHYDTCAWLPFPNFITPCNFLMFLLYQLLLTVLILGLAVLAGVAVGVLIDSPELAGITAYAALILIMVLILVGPANRHNANDNTSGVVTVLEIARSLPDNLRERVCFILFDLEEAGLVGSSSYWSKHKKIAKNQIVLNLDCVGDGNEIVFFPTRKLKKDSAKMSLLRQFCGKYGTKSIEIREKGFSYYPSDQAQFPYGIGICALKRGKRIGLYLDRIHTGKDTVFEETNVNLLRACLTSVIAANHIH